MNSHAQLPPAYRASKSSEYRKRIAALGTPLPQELRKRIEFANELGKAAPKPDDILLDLPALRESMLRIMDIAMANGFTRSRAHSSGYDLFKDLFYEHGVFMDSINSNLCVGPLIREEKIGGLDVFMPALPESQPRASFYGHERQLLGMPARMVLDIANFLEIAAYRINMIRFGELEPISSVLFSSSEHEQGVSRMLFKQRLKKLLPEGGLKDPDFRRLFHDISEGKGDHDSMSSAFSRVLIIRFTGLGVKAARSQDEVEHTLNLLNALIRSALVSHLTIHNELERLKAYHGIDRSNFELCKYFFESHLDHLFLIGWLSEIAHADPFFRIGFLIQDSLTGDNPALLYFKQNAMGPLLAKAGVQSPDILGSFYKILTCPPERLSHAAHEVLDEIYNDMAGKGFHEAFPGIDDAYWQVRETTFVTKDDLPIVAQIWHESGVNDF